MQDLRFTFQFRRHPGYATVCVLTLAIAIGANTAVFSVLDGVLLQPLPYPEPDRLVRLLNRYLPESGYDVPRFPLSLAEILDYREQAEALQSVGYYQSWPSSISSVEAPPQRVISTSVSKDVLPLLGVRPSLGRWFSPAEDLRILGLAAALETSTALEGLLFGVSHTDPLTFTAIPCYW